MTDRQTTMNEPDPIETLVQRAKIMRANYLRSVFSGVAQAVGRGWSAMLGRIRSNRIRNELSLLSDRELADIGLSRADIALVAKQAGMGQRVATADKLPEAQYRKGNSNKPANSDRPTRAASGTQDRHAA